jgi:hypothetical protein
MEDIALFTHLPLNCILRKWLVPDSRKQGCLWQEQDWLNEGWMYLLPFVSDKKKDVYFWRLVCCPISASCQTCYNTRTQTKVNSEGFGLKHVLFQNYLNVIFPSRLMKNLLKYLHDWTLCKRIDKKVFANIAPGMYVSLLALWLYLLWI